MPAPISIGEIPLWTFGQLERLKSSNLKRRALELHTAAGPELSPQLKSGLGTPALVQWILELQVAVCASAGVHVTLHDFGEPGSAIRFPTDVPSQHSSWKHAERPQAKPWPHEDDEEVRKTVAADANRGAAAAKAMHRGTLHSTLFAEPPEPEPSEYAGPLPPYQVAPPYYRPHTPSGKLTVSQTSFAPPPLASYRTTGRKPLE